MPTHYPDAGWHEQRPEDWWQAVVASTRELLARVPGAAADIECLAISGQSLGVVPVDGEGRLLRERTPDLVGHPRLTPRRKPSSGRSTAGAGT